MHGDVAHNMYLIPAAYQIVLNQLIHTMHWPVDSDLFGASIYNNS